MEYFEFFLNGSDDCADPNPDFGGLEEPRTQEELRKVYWPFLDEPVKRIEKETQHRKA